MDELSGLRNGSLSSEISLKVGSGLLIFFSFFFFYDFSKL